MVLTMPIYNHIEGMILLVVLQTIFITISKLLSIWLFDCRNWRFREPQRNKQLHTDKVVQGKWVPIVQENNYVQSCDFLVLKLIKLSNLSIISLSHQTDSKLDLLEPFYHFSVTFHTDSLTSTTSRTTQEKISHLIFT